MLLLITCTYNRPIRLNLIKNLSIMIGKLKDVKWIIIEDDYEIDEEVRKVLPDNAIYLPFGPTRSGGNAQRNYALEYIKKMGYQGIIYNMDDDNKYDIRIFDEIRKTKNVAFLPVGNLGPNNIERPIVYNGKFIRWDANWRSRKYCVDMAGYAFNSNLLKKLNSPLWSYFRHGGGEDEFLQKILNDINDAEFLCDNCTKVYVWHNGNVN